MPFYKSDLIVKNTDLHQIISAFNLDEGKLAQDLIEAMDALPRGASSIEDFSSDFEKMIKEAWMVCSLVYSDAAIRTGHLIIALKQNPELARTLHAISSEFKKINADLLVDNLQILLKTLMRHQL